MPRKKKRKKRATMQSRSDFAVGSRGSRFSLFPNVFGLLASRRKGMKNIFGMAGTEDAEKEEEAKRFFRERGAARLSEGNSLTRVEMDDVTMHLHSRHSAPSALD